MLNASQNISESLIHPSPSLTNAQTFVVYVCIQKGATKSEEAQAKVKYGSII